ncbi:MAG: bifunctional methionine sulfoxide reductase B/A protein [Patescibacteria group bacterium]
MKFNELTKKEAEIIEKKGTEAPFSGQYNDHFKKGIYICRRCGQPLCESKDKFKSGCGWPSFDEEIAGAVKRVPDADGQRTEITCANCRAHLGHVFTGEKLTENNTRHCVNSISMIFIPEDFNQDEENYTIFGGGCFWCLEAIFKEVIGVKNVISGYAGGYSLNPIYDNLDGHAEVIKVIFDSGKVKFNKLLEVFFSIHDSTTLDRQGNDVGPQYRSIILFPTLEQKKQAEIMIKELTEEKVFKNKIVTELKPLIRFYPAEDYHQDYFIKNKEKSYCQLVINPKLEKFKEKYKK